MPPRPFVNDALWRCLCPRYTRIPVTSGAGPVAARTRASVRTASRLCGATERNYNTSTLATANPPVSTESYFAGSPGTGQTPGPIIPRRRAKEPVSLVHLPTPDLYEQLRMEGAKGKHDSVMAIIQILIKDRRERPNLQMYTAWLHSYTDPEAGTAGKLRKVLEDMEKAGVEMDSRAAHCVLEALAVHPDSFLRADILEYMKERWFPLSPRGHNFVVAGLLRDRCFEQALEKLEEMVKVRIRVDEWLWDKTVWMLLEFGEVDEAFYVLSLKQNMSTGNVKLSGSLWIQLLDVAAKRHLPEAVSTIWNDQVIPGYLKPPTGTCLNVLSVTARSGDVKLATDVFRVLAERGTVFTPHHYEALIECYLVANDLPAALSVVLIMQDSSLKVTEDGLHPLYAYLCKKDSRPMDAFIQLRKLANSGRQIPTAVVNCCIRASVRKVALIAQAVEIYKALHTVCKAGPNTTTFNELFRGCHKGGRKELAMYLADEMIQLGIRPDRLTYDRLILVCLHSGDIDDALSYYKEMNAEGFVPRRGTLEMMIQYTVRHGDGRCIALLKDYKQQEFVVPARVATLERWVYSKFEEGGEARAKSAVQDVGPVENAPEALQKDLEGMDEGTEGRGTNVGGRDTEDAFTALEEESKAQGQCDGA